jgi:ABC-type nitrate/sulfonate/bicarbonate transport system substrate-binding protein
VPLFQIGGMPEIAAAISNGAIAAAPMSYPMAYVAQQAGAKLLANMAKEEIAFVYVGITTSGGFLRQRRAQAKAFVRGYARGVFHARRSGRFQENYLPLYKDHGSRNASGHASVCVRLR